ncbi:hypothetical protein ElyMa_001735200 [Elysia marginata]|uniref:Uncharacterized protein n=1 Tax=Elysia marginata TaxID=1093978 RepID=A0AAV4JZ17_9GAST|nr:hypothetical protein ElyMa_001735200 [Elysia marginata]
MFAITPRITDDYSLFNLLEDMASPYNRYQQRNMLPVQFGDGTMGHIGGRIGGSQDVDVNSATSTMNANGTLSIKMLKKALEAPREVNIPVHFEKQK